MGVSGNINRAAEEAIKKTILAGLEDYLVSPPNPIATADDYLEEFIRGQQKLIGRLEGKINPVNRYTVVNARLKIKIAKALLESKQIDSSQKPPTQREVALICYFNGNEPITKNNWKSKAEKYGCASKNDGLVDYYDELKTDPSGVYWTQKKGTRTLLKKILDLYKPESVQAKNITGFIKKAK